MVCDRYHFLILYAINGSHWRNVFTIMDMTNGLDLGQRLQPHWNHRHPIGDCQHQNARGKFTAGRYSPAISFFRCCLKVK